MATYRIQHCFQGGSGSSADQFCNNFHYTSAIPPDTIDVPSGNPYGSLIAGHVRDFYSALEAYMSMECNNAFRTIRIYDEAAAPNTPAAYSVTDSALPFTADGSVVNLPEEVAIVLSLSALTGTGNPARRKGRLYLGPLRVAALDASSPNTGPMHVNPALVTLLAGTASDFKDAMAGDDATWVVYSRSDDAAHEVIQVHVDNAFDTQRRRGVSASATTAFTV